MQECIEKGYSYCEQDGVDEQQLVRMFDKMRIGGMIKDFRFTYLGRSMDDNTITIHELLHVRRNNDVVDVYSVDIVFKDRDIVRVRMEKLFSI